MANRSFVLYDDWQPLFQALPEAKAGELIQAIFAYRADKETRPKDPVVNAVFEMIRARLDADAEKYAERCAKNRANASERLRTQANARKRQRNGTDNDNDNENDNDRDIKKRWRPAKERQYDFNQIEQQMLERARNE